MLSKTILAGLLSLSLTACGVLSKETLVEVPVKAAPPAQLLQDCPLPARTGDDNAALARLSQEQRQALEACNLDKRALRDFYAGS